MVNDVVYVYLCVGVCILHTISSAEGGRGREKESVECDEQREGKKNSIIKEDTKILSKSLWLEDTGERKRKKRKKRRSRREGEREEEKELREE